MENKFNFSRRVVDHRVPYDLNFAINQPTFTQGWKESYKQRWIGSLIKTYGLYAGFAACFVAIIGVYFDGIWRENRPLSHQSASFSGKNSRTLHFLRNYRNENTDLGNWNHNFACFEKDPNCGRDFTWALKTQKE